MIFTQKQYVVAIAVVAVVQLLYSHPPVHVATNKGDPTNLAPTDPKSRGLIFQVDSRYPGDGTTGDSAIVNYAYAMRHGYDYKYFQISTESEVNHLKGPAVHSATKMSSVCSLPGQQRATGWCKLLVMVELLKTTDYDWIHYIDTDAVFCNQDQSIATYLRAVPTLPTGKCRGSQSLVPLDGALFIGTTSDPWMFWYINTGQLIIRGSPLALHFVEQWWWQNGGEFNSVHPFEQAAFWKLEHCFRNYTANLQETVFFKAEGQFYCHFGSNSPSQVRLKGLAHERKKVKNPEQALETIRAKHTFYRSADKLVATAVPTPQAKNFPACLPEAFPHMNTKRPPDCLEPVWPAGNVKMPSMSYTEFLDAAMKANLSS